MSIKKSARYSIKNELSVLLKSANHSIKKSKAKL